MSDSILSSVIDSLKDLGRDIFHQAAGSAKDAVTSTPTQIVGGITDEKEAEKEAEKIATQQGIQKIEAEMNQIRAENQKKTGPEIPKTEEEKIEEAKKENPQMIDEASRQAMGKAEQGRNFKG